MSSASIITLPIISPLGQYWNMSGGGVTARSAGDDNMVGSGLPRLRIGGDRDIDRGGG